jgi:hypothetical protein
MIPSAVSAIVATAGHAERRGAQRCSREARARQDRGLLRPDIPGGNRPIRAEGAVMPGVEDVVEPSPEREEPDGDDEPGQEGYGQRQRGGRYVPVQRIDAGEQDDEPEVRNGPVGHGQARELERREDAEEGATHGGDGTGGRGKAVAPRARAASQWQK